jgi:hypothetical protein
LRDLLDTSAGQPRTENKRRWPDLFNFYDVEVAKLGWKPKRKIGMSARGNAERGFEMKRQTQLFQEKALMNATGYGVWLLTVRGWGGSR